MTITEKIIAAVEEQGFKVLNSKDLEVPAGEMITVTTNHKDHEFKNTEAAFESFLYGLKVQRGRLDYPGIGSKDLDDKIEKNEHKKEKD